LSEIRQSHNSAAAGFVQPARLHRRKLRTQPDFQESSISNNKGVANVDTNRENDESKEGAADVWYWTSPPNHLPTDPFVPLDVLGGREMKRFDHLRKTKDLAANWMKA
jgi:hypothetical protein